MLLQIDLGTTSITVGSIMLLIGIALSVFSFIKNNKKDIQGKASDYAVYKNKVDNLEKELAEAKKEMKELRSEMMDEIKKLDTQVIRKIDKVDGKIDDLTKLLMEKVLK